MNVETLDYVSLIDNDDHYINDMIEKSFGNEGLGLILIRNVPDYFENREKLLPLIRSFAILPEETKQKFERKDLLYQFGWSHGKEYLQDGSADEAKGSFYANPSKNTARNRDENSKLLVNGADIRWPSEYVPDLENAFRKVSDIMEKVVLKVAERCDVIATRKRGTNPHFFETLQNSKCHKGRLLYYYPPDEASKTNKNWCGWHCDHSMFTCLTRAMYFDASGRQCSNLEQDNLVIEARNGTKHTLSIPEDCLAIQLGQAAQIESFGQFKATPHCVSPPQRPHISRATYALFFQPESDYAFHSYYSKTPEFSASELPEQYKRGMTFGAFGHATVLKYSAPTASTTM